MTEHDDDPLWNPEVPADAGLARIQRLLAPYGSGARATEMPRRLLPRPRRRRRRVVAWATAAGLALLLAAAHFHRLAWEPGEPWEVFQASSGERERSWLAPGEEVATGDGETARIDVARIGSMTLSPKSRLRLLETESGRHSVALGYGHLRARIWAPPGYFRVGAGAAEVVDLGCDFELWQQQAGSGRILVRSGWISYRVGDDDILVAEGHTLEFADGVAGTPMRNDAPATLVDAVRVLQAALRPDRTGDAAAIAQAAGRVAEGARDADAFTLLSLLTRWPGLAGTDLYPRVAAALGQPADVQAHRSAWEANDRQAMNLWWNTLPRQPKHWWGGWKDLL